MRTSPARNAAQASLPYFIFGRPGFLFHPAFLIGRRTERGRFAFTGHGADRLLFLMPSPSRHNARQQAGSAKADGQRQGGSGKEWQSVV